VTCGVPSILHPYLRVGVLKVHSQRHAKEIAMDSAEHCRMQSEECRRLLALAQNKAEASALTYLSYTWLMIAGQIDRYVEIMKEAAQKK
jgi:hypothetical protein